MATLLDYYPSGTTGSMFAGDAILSHIAGARPLIVRTDVSKAFQFQSVQGIVERAFGSAQSGLITVDVVMSLDAKVSGTSEVVQWRNGSARGGALALTADANGDTQVRLLRLSGTTGVSAFTSAISGGVPTNGTRFRVQLANDGNNLTMRVFANDTTTTTASTFTSTTSDAINPSAVRVGIITSAGIGTANLNVNAIRVETVTTPAPPTYPPLDAEPPRVLANTPPAVEPWSTGVPLTATVIQETNPIASVVWTGPAGVLEAGSGVDRTFFARPSLTGDPIPFTVTVTDTQGLTGTASVDAPVYPATRARKVGGVWVPSRRTAVTTGAVTPPPPAPTVTRTLGVLQAETDAQIDQVAAAGANAVYVPARWSTLQPTAGGPLDMTTVNSRIDYAISKGLKVILRPGVQYAPTWAQTEIPLYVDQDGAQWASSNSGERIRDWVWSAIGKQRVESFYAALIQALTPERKAAISSVQTGFGIYGETQMPRVNLTAGIENIKWWGFSAPAQTGTGLASDQVVCPFPGHKPFNGVPEGTVGSATDLAWVDWYRNSVRVRMNSLVGALRAGGWTGPVQVLHPSFGVRSNWDSGDFGWREQNAQGVDWRHQVSGYTDAETYPWCTDVGKVDPWHTPTVESDYSAGWFLSTVATENGRTAHLGGENTGGGTIADQDRFFTDLERYGYKHALYAFYSTLVDGTGDTLANFTPNAQAFLAAGATPVGVLHGVNSAGAEFDGLPGTYDSDASFAYYASRGHDRIRVATKWENLQPTLGGALSTVHLDRLKAAVSSVTSRGMLYVLNIHNYMRHNGTIVTGTQLADLWTRLANEFKGNPLVEFGLMNEPNQLGGTDADQRAYLQAAIQQTINAIRATGSTNFLWLPSIQWSAAYAWKDHYPTWPYTDSAGRDRSGPEGHYYFDASNGNQGTYPNTYAADNTRAQQDGVADLTAKVLGHLQDFTDYCTSQNVKGLIGEVGWPNSSAAASNPGDSAAWNALGDAFYQAATAAGVSVTYWAAGEQWGTGYNLSAYTGTPQSTATSVASVIEAYNS